ncbi:MAG: D-2-hydroxyacid dehydrogenase [Planctomycetaceae bacterium]|nr:D-2-hydroxyacid dehydrogenase [Planctomycetaceae bacterium]
MSQKLVLYPPVDDRRLDLIREAAGEMTVANPASDEAALAEIADADAFFGKITPELLAAATQLKWVQSPTASLEHYLFEQLVAHPCQLSNMRGLFYDVIADHVMSFITCFARNLHLYIRRQIESKWAPVGGEDERSTFAAGPHEISGIDRQHIHLADCTMGVVGVGSIGAEICRRGQAFGMNLLAVDPMQSSIPGTLDEVWLPDRLPELLETSDFVVIAAPHTPETFKLFRTEQFEQMKSSAYLINIGRGVIVDLEDLTAALESGQIAGAALDVFETEPLPEDHRLWNMENVLITPHIAAASVHIAKRHLETLLENIRRFAAGQGPATLVDKTKWY